MDRVRFHDSQLRGIDRRSVICGQVQAQNEASVGANVRLLNRALRRAELHTGGIYRCARAVSYRYVRLMKR